MDKPGDLTSIAQDAINAFEVDSNLKKRSSVDAVKRALRQMDMFSQLNGRPDSEELLSSVIGHLGYKSFKEGTSIYSEGLFGNRVYFILGGKVALCEKKSAGDVEREQSMLANSPTRRRQKRQEAEAQEFWDTAVRSPEKKKPEGDPLQLSQNASLVNGGDKQQYQSIKPMCSLGRFESFGNVSKEPTTYKNTAIAEIETQLCFIVVSELHKKLQDNIVSIGVVTKVMESVLPNLRYEQAKRACYVPEYKIWSQGDSIFQENEPVKNYYLIKSGSVNIYKSNVQSLLKNKVGTAARQPLSDQYLFKTLKQGAIFGLEEMFLSGQRYFTAECATPLTEIYEIKTGNNMAGLPIDAETKRELKYKSKELLETRLKELCAKIDESGYQMALSAHDVEISCALQALNSQQFVNQQIEHQQQPPSQPSSVASSQNPGSLRRRIKKSSQPDLSSIAYKEMVPKIPLSDLEQTPSMNRISRNLSLSQLPHIESSPRLKNIKASQIFDGDIKKQPSIQLSPSKKQVVNNEQFFPDQFQADNFEENAVSNRAINSPSKSVIKRRGNSSVHVQSTQEIQRQPTSSSIYFGQASHSTLAPQSPLKKQPFSSYSREELASSPLSYKKKQSSHIFSQDLSPIRLPPISDSQIFSYKNDGSEPLSSRKNMSPSQPRFSPNPVYSPTSLQKSSNLIKSSLHQLEQTDEFEPKQLLLHMLPISQQNAKPENFIKLRNPSNHAVLTKLVMPHKCSNKDTHL